MTEPQREVGATAENRGVVEAENFSFWYGEKQALHGINLSMRPRSVTALVGP